MDFENTLYTNPKFQQDFVDAFFETIQSNMEQICELKVYLGESSVNTLSVIKKRTEIYGCIVVPFKLFGNVTITASFEEKLILKIVELFVDEVYTEINSDVLDTVGELTNIFSTSSQSFSSYKGIFTLDEGDGKGTFPP
jgi:CheY-specific phosphatase CheX